MYNTSQKFEKNKNIVENSIITYLSVVLVLSFYIGPNPVSNIALLVDATNLTLQFPRPEGLIDYYTVEYTLLKPPLTDQNQTIASISATWITAASSSGSKNFTDSGGSAVSTVNLGLDDLIAGAGYALRIRTCSHSMYSDPVNLEAHTSKFYALAYR